MTVSVVELLSIQVQKLFLRKRVLVIEEIYRDFYKKISLNINFDQIMAYLFRFLFIRGFVLNSTFRTH